MRCIEDLQQEVVVGSFSECWVGTLGQRPLSGRSSGGISRILLGQARTTGYPNKIAHYTVKNLAIFASPAGMSLTKLSLAGNNLNIPGQGEFGK